MCTEQIPVCRCDRCLDIVKLGRRDFDKYSYATGFDYFVDCGSEKCSWSDNHRYPCRPWECLFTCKQFKDSKDVEVHRQSFLCGYCKRMAPWEYQKMAWRKN